MTTFSSGKHDSEYEDYEAESVPPAIGASGAERPETAPPRVAFNPTQEDAYAIATSGYENAYVNALCAELSNMMQFTDKRDAVRNYGFDVRFQL